MLEAGGAVLQLAGRYAGGGPCTLALRPERLRLAPPGGGGQRRGHGRAGELSRRGARAPGPARPGPAPAGARRAPAGAGRLHAAGEPVALALGRSAPSGCSMLRTRRSCRRMTDTARERMTSHA